MTADPFAVLAEPVRRRILDQLRQRDHSVNELVDRLGLAQPSVSKHLKVLREAGLVTCESSAQQRIYRLQPKSLKKMDTWLAPYRRLWTAHLDALERHLDRKDTR